MENDIRKSARIWPALAIALALQILIPLQIFGQNPPARDNYQKYFRHFSDTRSFSEKALNTVGLTNQEVGRSFALIAGINKYPNLDPAYQFLEPAGTDIENLVRYLRDSEFFDEIVVLQNFEVTSDNFTYFLQEYFPERLTRFPRSRFLFAYSGHGVQNRGRGYILRADATSFQDKARRINLATIADLYQESAEAAYHSIALINSCYSGSFLKKQSHGVPRRLLPRDPGSHAITAGTSGELTWGLPHSGSIFFEKIIAGLNGPADNQPISLW